MANHLLIVGHPGFGSGEGSGAQEVANEILKLGGFDVREVSGRAVDMNAERAAWEAAAGVVLHFPLYWYGMPGHLKSYFDELLAPGWAFGEAHVLEGKPILTSITTGAPLASYREGERNEHSLETYMLPVARTARFCKMNWRGVVATGSVPKDVPAGRWVNHAEEIRARMSAEN